MQTALECLPCLVRQSLDACTRVLPAGPARDQALRRALGELASADYDLSPPYLAWRVHQLLREETGVPDPYAADKAAANRFCLELLPDLRTKLEASSDRLATAVRLAIAGNIIDCAVGHLPSAERVAEVVAQALTQPLDPAGLSALCAAREKARTILYLTDNAGEIVLDRLLIETLGPERVTVAVKSGPIINDALLADAETAGLTALTAVIDNGSDAPGTILELCSPDFRRHFQAADLVISKGQGNYETLNQTTRSGVFFLLKAKCPQVAQALGVQVGDLVLTPNR